MRIRYFVSSFFLYICFFLFSHCFAKEELSTLTQNVERKSTPDWVRTLAFPNPENNSSQPHIQYLLFDRQVNVETMTVYHRLTLKILDIIGVENESNVSIDFDPSYQTLIIHHVEVIREGKIIDKWSDAKRLLIQQEEDAEKLVYNGRLTYLLFLEDIREGDILNCSYSIVGFSPVKKAHFYDFCRLQFSQCVEKIHYRILSPATKNLKSKNFNSENSPNIVLLPSGYTEWIWEINKSKPLHDEPYVPDWYIEGAYVQVSEFENWNDVAKCMTCFFSLSGREITDCSDELEALLSKWKYESVTDQERALKALRYVQDRIRYLGLEFGNDSFKPEHPAIVWKRRYGDCKDKVILLHFLLQQLGIESHPCLVHTHNGQNLPEWLPNPGLFNHAILQIHMHDKIYWVDPTISFQGGNLDFNFCPDYKYGLVLENNTQELSSKPENFDESAVSTTTTFHLDLSNVVISELCTIYTGSEADFFRQTLKKIKNSELQKSYEDFFRTIYHPLKSAKDIVIVDDREQNQIIVKEEYELENPFEIDETDKKNLFFTPLYIQGFLKVKVDPERHTPLHIQFPKHIKERITIVCPNVDWSYESNEEQFAHKALQYQIASKVEEDLLHVDFVYTAYADYVESEDVPNFLNLLDTLKDKSIHGITIRTKDKQHIPFEANSSIAIIFVCLASFIGGALLKKYKF